MTDDANRESPMSPDSPDPLLEEYARRLAERTAVVDHPAAATWAAYAADRIDDADEMERLRDHLVRCRPCRAQVLEATRGVAPDVDRPEPTMPPTFEERRALAELRRRIEAAESGVRVATSHRNYWRWGAIAASLLALASGATAFHAWRTLRSPVAGETFIELPPDSEARRGAGDEIDARAADNVNLILQVPHLAAGTNVRVEILAPVGGLLWRARERAPRNDLYLLRLPTRYLSGGKIRLYRDDDPSGEPLATYTLPVDVGEDSP